MSNVVRAANNLPLPVPCRFTISIVRGTGDLAQEYPTFSLSYVGCSAQPPGNGPSLEDIFNDAQAFAVNIAPVKPGSDESSLEIVTFTQPQKELLDFSDSYFLKSTVPTKSTSDIFKKISELGKYVILVNTENFSYQALVDDSSGEILEIHSENRFLN